MNEFKPYAKALFALKDLNKTKLGRILRPMTYDVLEIKYGIRFETKTWMNQANKILASDIQKSPGAIAVLSGNRETGVGKLHLDHEPSIKMLKAMIANAKSEADVLGIIEQMDFQFLTPDENYKKA